MSQFCQLNREQVCCYCNQSANWGFPVYGPPAGYGVMQLDPTPGLNDLWNWQTGVTNGKNMLDIKSAAAYPYWTAQVQQWNAYNAPLSSKNRVSPPLDQVYALSDGSGVVTYTLPLNTPWNSTARNSVGLTTATGPNGAHWFGDAVLIKQYGGVGYYYCPLCVSGGCYAKSQKDAYGNPMQPQCGQQTYFNYNYITWLNNLPPGTPPYWLVFPNNTVSSDVVGEVSSCVGPPRNCTSQPPTTQAVPVPQPNR